MTGINDKICSKTPQVSLTVLGWVIGVIISLSATVYGITVSNLKENDVRFEQNLQSQEQEIKQTRELMIRIDQRLANIENVLGVKNKNNLNLK